MTLNGFDFGLGVSSQRQEMRVREQEKNDNSISIMPSYPLAPLPAAHHIESTDRLSIDRRSSHDDDHAVDYRHRSLNYHFSLPDEAEQNADFQHQPRLTRISIKALVFAALLLGAFLGVALWMIVRAVQLVRGDPPQSDFYLSFKPEDDPSKKPGTVILFVIGGGVVLLAGGGFTFTMYLLYRKLRNKSRGR